MGHWEDFIADVRYRYGDGLNDHEMLSLANKDTGLPELWRMLVRRGSVRRFQPRQPSLAELRMIAAAALAAPTKSDLQQRDIILVTDTAKMAALKALISDQAWTQGAPALVIFCANNRRQRVIHEMRQHSFVNDHLDAFFNASVDGGIVLASFVLAAEAAGFGTCPISAIRNYPEEASEILDLPDYVFAIAGLAIGYAAQDTIPSLRLPLSVTVHDNSYQEQNLEDAIDTYDQRRAALQPYMQQRRVAELGAKEVYTWSEDKTRQYSLPERVDFGAFIRKKGFCLD